MSIKVAINGFGRIGRCVARAIFEYQNEYDIELVAINSTAGLKDSMHLLKYDSIHGRFAFDCSISGDSIIIAGQEVRIISERDLNKINWQEFGVDVVLECTGVFKDKKSCQQHIDAGAKKVIISAPAQDEDIKTIIYGVNEAILNDADNIISIGSCTTNCLAPVAKILNDNIGIRTGFVTTIHAYTNDQNLADNRHKDLRRARAATMSMIPTSTGAAKAIAKVIPNLAGKIDGIAIRVPTPNVSMIDFCFVAEKSVDVAEVNACIREGRAGSLKQVLDYEEEDLVSIDYNHSPYSSVFDSTGTRIMPGDFIRVAAWYDNEWGFSKRMLDVAALIG
jgi:glyceraldehyde 3-phosphate dehydrogenase